jgi:hypothetical protein
MTNDATTALLRALRGKFAPAVQPVFEEIRSRTWASVTFTGTRHEIVLRFGGEQAAEAVAAADRFLADLDGAEFQLRNHILADIALVARESMPGGGVRIRIEALTVEDA